MPFDNLPSRDLGPLTPESLCALLRDRSRWPVGFRWDYNHTSTCAIGLMRRVWGNAAAADMLYWSNVPFTGAYTARPRPRSVAPVTPEEVANLVEAQVAVCAPFQPRRQSRRRPVITWTLVAVDACLAIAAVVVCCLR